MKRKIKTQSGILTGLVNKENIAVFKGVPYALPPTGPRRFQRPVEINTPETERDTFAFSAAPIQSQFGKRPEYEISEDCLYLNVWTPGDAGDKLPVMVWFYGGGFNRGRADDPEFDGARLAKRGVVVVTVNYRLGVLGFLAHKYLSAQDPDSISGNYGLYDQQCALKWVKNNITAFGGAPSKVTIFGQSAGGISCRVHLVSEGSRGLFRRAIIESGGGTQ